jgi:palmitoyl-protein thioesterase
MVKFLNDTMVVPKESTWFGFFGKGTNISPVQELPIYTEDWLGLRTLDEVI